MRIVIVAIWLVAWAPVASGGGMQITGCSLGCGGSGPITCATTEVFQNEEIRVEFSQAVLASSLAPFTFSITSVANGAAAQGALFVDPTDARTVVFRPTPVFDDAGTLSFGFAPGATYRIRVAGSDAGPGLFVKSVGGASNQTALDCSVVASRGVIEAPTFCYGDAQGGCPCGANEGTTHGCANSAGTLGGRLTLLDQRPDGAGGGRFAWIGSGLPAGCPVVLFRSTMQNPGGVGVPFGDGLLCLAKPVVRIDASFSGLGYVGDLQGHGAGSGTFHYQLWVRDDALFCTTRPFNATNAATLVW